MHIKTSLLREKFTIEDESPSSRAGAVKNARACSNRMVVHLQTEELARETFIVRTDSMHLCARMAGQLLADYENRGPFNPRMKDIKWNLLWNSALSDYERRYNKRRWVAVYHKGKPVYAFGEHHSFLDIVEQFETVYQTDSYAQSLVKAEDAFKKAGKDVTIDYNSNVALVFDMERQGGRCSTILRAPHKTTSFHFALKPQKKNEKVVISVGLTSAGHFLEGMNLSYFIGMSNAYLEAGKIEEHSSEFNQMRHARQRLDEISASLSTLENRYQVRYRPERPDFNLMITQTENYVERSLLTEAEPDQEQS
ncbi:MAG: hypothetical protein ACLFRA_01780 [Alphaproteobacteria bacterium]